MSQSAMPANSEIPLPRQLVDHFGIESRLAEHFGFALSAMGLAGVVDQTRSQPAVTVGRSPTHFNEAFGAFQTWRPQLAQAARQEVAVALEPLCYTIGIDDDSIIEWLRKAVAVQLDLGGGAWEAEPQGEPRTIHEIAGNLLEPYHVRNGHVRLAGCTLEAFANLRVGCFVSSHSTEKDPLDGAPKSRIQYRYSSSNGASLDQAAVAAGGFDQLHAISHRLKASDHESIETWVKIAVGAIPKDDLADVTVIWSRKAAGKIVFQFENGGSASIAFDGLARRFAHGLEPPPKFRCPHSGLESYRVIQLDDGTTTVAEAVGCCQESGRECLASNLERCQITGKLVDKRLLGQCSITGQQVLADRLQSCSWCGLAVSANVNQGARCSRCRSGQRLCLEDTGLRQLVNKNPSLQSDLTRGGLRRNGLTGWIAKSLGLVVITTLVRQKMYVFNPIDGMILRSGQRRRPLGEWTIDKITDIQPGSGKETVTD